jgi:hypothetical protein
MKCHWIVDSASIIKYEHDESGSKVAILSTCMVGDAAASVADEVIDSDVTSVF